MIFDESANTGCNPGPCGAGGATGMTDAEAASGAPHPVLAHLQNKIRGLKAKKLDIFTRLREAMRMAAKVEYYKGSLRALDEEIQQTRLNMKRKQLQLKLAKQNQDLAEIESIASDLQDKMVDLHSTKEAIRDAVQTTSTNIHRLGMTGNPSPGQQVKQVGMVVDSLAANQNAAMDSLTRSQNLNTDTIIHALKDAIQTAKPEANVKPLEAMLSTA
ncbi:hypothetical protein AAMO2058_000859300 [Amorphochlora amoebiformis]